MPHSLVGHGDNSLDGGLRAEAQLGVVGDAVTAAHGHVGDRIRGRAVGLGHKLNSNVNVCE